MKEDTLRGFTYTENGQVKINHEDLASIERIYTFLLRNVKELKDIRFATMILLGNLEKVIRDKVCENYPELQYTLETEMPDLITDEGFDSLYRKLEEFYNEQ